MVREKKKGKIILISSTLGYMSFIGYSSYSPAKHALRGNDCPLQIFFGDADDTVWQDLAILCTQS